MPTSSVFRVLAIVVVVLSRPDLARAADATATVPRTEAEWVARDSASVRYMHTTARRALSLTKVASQPAGDFDATIWNH